MVAPPSSTDHKRIVLRDACLRHLQETGTLTDERVLHAMRHVPRERFVPFDEQAHAWDDHPLPIGQGQTISAPHMYAMMAQAADLKIGQRVLEIGTGSGYGAALAKELVGKKGEIYTLELYPALAASAQKALQECHYDVKVIVGDGHEGYAPAAPYERILVTAAALDLPPSLWTQLKIGGKLIIPLGGSYGTLMLFKKIGPEIPAGIPLAQVAFVPLQRKEDCP